MRARYIIEKVVGCYLTLKLYIKESFF